LLHQFGGTNGIYAVNDNGSDRRVVVPGIDSSVRFLPPDGTRLLYIAADPATGNQDLWLTDLRGGAPNRVSTGPDVDHLAAFSPDGSEVVWEQHAAGNLVIMRRPTDLSAPAEMLMEWNRGGGPTDWSPDGTFILYGSSDDETQGNLWAVPLDGGEQRAIIDAPFDEDGGRFSPDGNWLAYTSDESGRREIYIQRLEGTDRIGGPQRVSSDGGVKPQWRGDGRELFFLQGTMLMAVDMDLAGDRPAGTPRELFDIGQRVQYMDYLVAPDGQSFTAIVQATDAPAGAATMIMNWGAGR
jgi:Tol biopolymer transport system component